MAEHVLGSCGNRAVAKAGRMKTFAATRDAGDEKRLARALTLVERLEKMNEETAKLKEEQLHEAVEKGRCVEHHRMCALRVPLA